MYQKSVRFHKTWRQVRKGQQKSPYPINVIRSPHPSNFQVKKHEGDQTSIPWMGQSFGGVLSQKEKQIYCHESWSPLFTISIAQVGVLQHIATIYVSICFFKVQYVYIYIIYKRILRSAKWTRATNKATIKTRVPYNNIQYHTFVAMRHGSGLVFGVFGLLSTRELQHIPCDIPPMMRYSYNTCLSIAYNIHLPIF